MADGQHGSAVNEPFASILKRRLSRRDVLQSGAALGAALVVPARAAPDLVAHGAGFKPVAGSRADAVRVPAGYTAQVVIGWGDALWPGEPSLDTGGLAAGMLLQPGAAADQERRFGYNCDALVFFPLDRDGRRGLLCVNHEYTNDELMFPDRLGLGREGAAVLAAWCRKHPEAAQVGLAAHGASVIELRLEGGRWRVEPHSRYRRRVTGRTPIEIAGPARGHRLLATAADPAATRVAGMLNNCAGGRTPWGTFLTAEENIDDYFGGYQSWAGAVGSDARLRAAHRRFPLLESSHHGWEHTEARFDVRQEPAEALRFGWIVEIDPRDPTAPIRKRTALGRFSHEGASCTLARDGRVVVYSGDDDDFEYLYKFVSRDRYEADRPQAAAQLLDHGTLYVARFDADGSGRWLPLVQGYGPLTARAGFADQGEVVIRARAAADLLGATPMDRPEDVEIHPQSGRVYVALTKNADRAAATEARDVAGRRLDAAVDAANPRPANRFGHVLELEEEGGDAAAERFRWNVFLLCGDPAAPGNRFLTDAAALQPGRLQAGDTYYAGAQRSSELAPIGCPDNLGFDKVGRLWIVTDGDQPRGDHNGAFVVPVTGEGRGQLRQFMSAPAGAEISGCEFTPDGTTLFFSVQHPGEAGTLARPRSDWPDGGGRPPRPCVIAIRRDDGGPVGG